MSLRTYVREYQLEWYPEVRSTTGKRNLPADFVAMVFVDVEDGGGVRVADGVVVCEFLRTIRVFVKEVWDVLFECVFFECQLRSSPLTTSVIGGAERELFRKMVEETLAQRPEGECHAEKEQDRAEQSGHQTRKAVELGTMALEAVHGPALLAGAGNEVPLRPAALGDGRTLLAGPDEAGDEPCLIAARCPQAVVAVGADRLGLGRWVLERFPLDYVLLDDGFQHRSFAY
jgi:hypothetical protein